MQEQFDKVFTDLFGASYFGNLKVPKLQAFVFKNVQRFVDGISSDVKYFDSDKRQVWNIIHFFMGELYSDAKEQSVSSCRWFRFDKKAGTVWADEEVIFSLLVLVKQLVHKKLGTLKSTGFKDWLKDENYAGFLRQFRYHLSRKDLCAGIMRGRSPNVPYFRSQDDVLKFLSGPGGKKKVQLVIDICKARSPGGWIKKKEFTVEGLYKKAEDMYNEICKTLPSHKGPKKKRISKRKCLNYIQHLALMGTIQTRVNEPVSLSSAKESRFFTYYRVFRDAACRLGMLDLVDESFAPGIRCRSYMVKIMCKPLKKVEPVLMNKIEKKFRQISQEEKRKFASGFGYNAYEYLSERSQLKFLEDEVKYAIKQNSKIGCAIGNFAAKNGKLWVHKKFQQINQNRSKREFFYYERIGFHAKWSDPRRYNWMMYERVA